MGGAPTWVVEQVAHASDFEPFAPDGVESGQIYWVQRHDGGGELAAAIWRADPCTFDYLFDSDEVCYVLSGEASVELIDERATVALRPGDVAYFKSGTRAIWTIVSAFTKVVVGPAAGAAAR